MKFEKKFLSQEQQHVSETQSQAQQTIHEFATPEQVLRYDAKQTRVPDRVAERLGRSMKNQPRVAQPWWKRFFS